MGYKKGIPLGIDRAEWYINQPLGYHSFPKEIFPVPRSWAAQTGNLKWFRGHAASGGGHFAALEKPDVVAKDIEDCFGEIWDMRSRTRESKL
jgi:microsomal epoxide hydrolase